MSHISISRCKSLVTRPQEDCCCILSDLNFHRGQTESPPSNYYIGGSTCMTSMYIVSWYDASNALDILLIKQALHWLSCANVYCNMLRCSTPVPFSRVRWGGRLEFLLMVKRAYTHISVGVLVLPGYYFILIVHDYVKFGRDMSNIFIYEGPSSLINAFQLLSPNSA